MCSRILEWLNGCIHLFILSGLISLILYARNETLLKYPRVSDDLLHDHKKCFEYYLHRRDDWRFSLSLDVVINFCSMRQRLDVRIDRFPNTNEVKYMILPKENVPTTVLTIGIGQDINAEKLIKEALPNTSFIGADPVEHPNRELYETLGIFHNIAVEAGTGTETAYVLIGDKYVTTTVEYIDFPTFIDDYIQPTIVDLLLLDAEGGEFGILPHLLSLSNSTSMGSNQFCQVNVEIHVANRERRAAVKDFFTKLVNNSDYLPLMAERFGVNQVIFMVNIADSECECRYGLPLRKDVPNCTKH